jgi:phage baseplate assembly protein W
MNSIAFPDMFSKTNTKIAKDYAATAQNLKMLLWSEKGELFGDPYFGTGVKKYLSDPNDAILRDILIDDLYTAIATFMPQIYLTRKDITITSDRSKVVANIKALNRVNFTTNMYNIILLETEA